MFIGAQQTEELTNHPRFDAEGVGDYSKRAARGDALQAREQR
jgi:hypothetical protein